MLLQLEPDFSNPGLDLCTPQHSSEHLIVTLTLHDNCMECWRYLSRDDLQAIVEWCAAVLENLDA